MIYINLDPYGEGLFFMLMKKSRTFLEGARRLHTQIDVLRFRFNCCSPITVLLFFLACPLVFAQYVVARDFLDSL